MHKYLDCDPLNMIPAIHAIISDTGCTTYKFRQYLDAFGDKYMNSLITSA